MGQIINIIELIASADIVNKSEVKMENSFCRC